MNKSIFGNGTGITQAKLKKLVHYDPLTGYFTWKVHVRRSHKEDEGVGDRADYIQYDKTNDRKYRKIFMRRAYQAGQLAWLYVHGTMPKGKIRYVNGDPLDIRLENLADTGSKRAGKPKPVKVSKLPKATNPVVTGMNVKDRISAGCAVIREAYARTHDILADEAIITGDAIRKYSDDEIIAIALEKLITIQKLERDA